MGRTCDPEGIFRFGSLQSQEASALLRREVPDAEINLDALDSIVLVERGAAYAHSTAVLRIFSQLHIPWKLLYGFIAVSSPVRN